MYQKLQNDLDHLQKILNQAALEAGEFLDNIDARPAGLYPPPLEPLTLPSAGLGAEQALTTFKERYGATISGSPGPRYFGFVTGGATPAALVGDWLTATFDQNSIESDISAAHIELEAIGFLRTLFGLPPHFSGTFVTGATMATFVGLAQGRQWVAKQHQIDVGRDGLYGLPPIKILSGMPHSTIFKALAMLGMGRGTVEPIPCLPHREAVDLDELRQALDALDGVPCIVVGNAGTVNTVDFDDLQALGALKVEYNFWLHVDGAFGGFAACAPAYQHLMAGIEHADSITIDAHKWLNVPYDAAMQFTPHQELQMEVFQMHAAYLGESGQVPDFFHLTPESSRRLRALPAWFSLLAYGREGYADIVERNCVLAKQLGEKISASESFRLLAPTRMNVVCFTLDIEPSQLSTALIDDFLGKLCQDGRIFLTPTNYAGIPAIRIAISNWRTEAHDIEIAWQALTDTIALLKNEKGPA